MKHLQVQPLRVDRVIIVVKGVLLTIRYSLVYYLEHPFFLRGNSFVGITVSIFLATRLDGDSSESTLRVQYRDTF